jgi:hypothetical protein
MAVPLRSTLTECSEGSVGGKEPILGAELGVAGQETGDDLLVLMVSNAGDCRDGRSSIELRSFGRLL